MSMTSNRPYLIRAFYDWIVDNECTPYVVVDAYFDGVEVPQQHVSDGQIVLNIAPRAVAGFLLEEQQVSFSTRFGGIPTEIHFPVAAVLGIYAKENGQGMVFQHDDSTVEPAPVQGVDTEDDDNTPPPSGSGKSSGASRPSLRVVK